MAEEENTEESKSSGAGKGMIIALIALVVILLLAVAGGAYFLYSQGLFSPKDGATTEEMTKKEEAGDSKETFKANVDDLVLNITNAKGKEKLMKLSFAVKSVEPTIEAIMEEYRAEVIDVVIAQISARSSEELLTVGGKALLKDELLEEINGVINEVTSNNEDIKANNIKKILFTTFVIK
ncbi:flagellar basal body-associated FliL family protein [Poseidonibacter ostreae]|jgi:flagellar protein FliL|uniref:Flagellar protein FliL n=1 Tax=Poseidonibacter ostreae TaxID=2654171 RepID=A0A6L4WN94_9BACT|nr:flagellar basal body-associated FliL family protein [Poseidonibacter ostreae]KAB7884405.1 flagellar basal body protein FliL [Poseidonibacter ostreae]KAB7885936.1 flagellar basal body protein FliL [Poseidonibacter ostreae]KAB7886652.1 flagellar basal body protein FliL [Poseidonibacter ostreae]MAC83349.1 flagellar basal body protein FliL [Arcobacter sp.]|tara:strand:+ start:2130 stop:2669 length:540 start_codon:yes stop_codon:yes gene_type:complete